MRVDTTALDQEALIPIFAGFELAGFELLYVGGCVRNVLMEVGATDIDLATDATPSQCVTLRRLLACE